MKILIALMFVALTLSGCKKETKTQDKNIVYVIKIMYQDRDNVWRQPTTFDGGNAAEITYTLPNGIVGKKRIAGNDLINFSESHLFKSDDPSKSVGIEWKAGFSNTGYRIWFEIYRTGSTGGLKDGLLIRKDDAYFGSVTVPINADPI